MSIASCWLGGLMRLDTIAWKSPKVFRSIELCIEELKFLH